MMTIVILQGGDNTYFNYITSSQDLEALARPKNMVPLPAMTLKVPSVLIVAVQSNNVSFCIKLLQDTELPLRMNSS